MLPNFNTLLSVYRFFIIAFLLLCFTTCFAQTATIDSLKKILPLLKDTARIDCLASIGECYTYYISSFNKDSASCYTNIIYEGSKKLNYNHGIAEAYSAKSFLAGYGNNFFEAEQLAEEALKYFSLTSNKKKIAVAYCQLSNIECRQGNYDKALINSKLCYECAIKTNDDDRMGFALEAMTDVYRERGDYEKLMNAQQELIQRDRRGDSTRDYTVHELWVMGLMYMLLEEYPTALSYWRKLFSGNTNKFLSVFNLTEYAQLLTLANETDSALYYYNLFDSIKANPGRLRFFLVSKGEYYFFLEKYKTALPYFLKALTYHRQANDLTQVKRTLLDIAKTCAALNNNDSGLSYARQGLLIALHSKSKPSMRDGYKILYSIYDRLHQTDSAFYYYQHYIEMKEAVMNAQTKGKVAVYKYEHKVDLMDKEKLISDQQLRLQQQKLAEESLQKKILVISIAVILLISAIVFRNIMLKRRNEKIKLQNELHLERLQNEKTQSEMRQQSTELELQALRAQMNPHFIFNCLSSVNRFILINRTEEASDYLTKFSRLIRMALHNSEKPYITLENELETLRLYLDLERLRFKNAFNYSISLVNTIDVSAVFIPPMLFQPFIENAIWHGLMHLPDRQAGKPDAGFLDITLSIDEEILTCIITDNGIGRNNASMINSKSAEKNKSMGVKITTERLALLSRNEDEQAVFNIEDLTDKEGNAAGTKVILKMKYRKLADVFEHQKQ